MLFNTYLLSICYTPSIVRGTGARYSSEQNRPKSLPEGPLRSGRVAVFQMRSADSGLPKPLSGETQVEVIFMITLWPYLLFPLVVTFAVKWVWVGEAAGLSAQKAVAQVVPVVIALFTITLKGSEKGPVSLKNVLEEIVKMANLLYLSPALCAFLIFCVMKWVICTNHFCFIAKNAVISGTSACATR